MSLSLSCPLLSLVKPISFYAADKSFPLHFYSMELHATEFFSAKGQGLNQSRRVPPFIEPDSSLS
jgi:hypothetical protein